MKTVILKVLILGGTNFLGPHLVQELQEHGYEVTLFNRGTQNGVNFPNTESLQGDRDGDLDALKNRFWDAIIDTSGYLPRVVEASSKILKSSTNHYTFISTIGVYANYASLDIDENCPLAKLEDASTEEINEKTYGALKASCEKVIERYFPQHLIVRPGLIVGPGNPTNRFSYWPLRVLEGGEVLAPGNPEQNVQFIDVHDLTKWMVSLIEKQKTGVFNATGPASPLTFEQLLKACPTKERSITWAAEDFLIEHNVQDWTELPLWLSYRRNWIGFFRINSSKAIQEGLTFTPLSKTISTVIDWETQNPKERPLWLTRKKEQELLKLWKG